MLRWSDVADQELYGLTVKMYREPYTCLESVTSIYRGLELDHYAYKHLGSELLAYKILDVNFEHYMEDCFEAIRAATALNVFVNMVFIFGYGPLFSDKPARFVHCIMFGLFVWLGFC